MEHGVSNQRKTGKIPSQGEKNTQTTLRGKNLSEVTERIYCVIKLRGKQYLHSQSFDSHAWALVNNHNALLVGHVHDLLSVWVVTRPE